MISLIAAGDYTAILCSSLLLTLLGHLLRFLWLIFDGLTIDLHGFNPGLSGEGGTPYNCLEGEAPPKRDTFFRLRLNERVGISLVEVYIKRIRKHVVKGP